MNEIENYQKKVRKLAHELRTPLSVICMGLEVMPAVRNDDEQFETIHQFMDTAGKELTQLIDSMASQGLFENAERTIDSQ